MKLHNNILRWVCSCTTAARLAIAAIAVIAIPTACTTDSLPAATETVTSTPSDSLGTIDLTLTAATRATTTHITQEEANNFLVTIYKGSDLVRTATRLADLNTSLPAGYGYRVMAENCTREDAVTANDGWGQKRFAGYSTSFAVKAGQTTAVNVGCSVANAAIEVVFDQSVAEFFTTSYSVTVTDGDRVITFDSTTAGSQQGDVVTDGRTAYFNLDDDGTHQVEYTIHAVGPKTLTRTGTLTLSQAKISRINLNYERSLFDFVITLDEQEMVIDEVVNITDADITTEDGTTDIIATHAPYTADPTDIDTRAVLNPDGLTMSWEDGDAIAVFDATTAKHSFTASTASDGRTRFAGKVTPRSQAFAAIYPYDLAVSGSVSSPTGSEGGGTSADIGAAIAATIPTTQNAVASNIASALNISVAKGQRNIDGSPVAVTFHNIPQLLRFTIPAYAEDKIKSIQLTATTAIAGRVNISLSGDTPSTSIATTESHAITILPPQRVSTFEAGTYYIAAAPVALSGFTLTYTCDGKTYTQTSTTAFGGQSGRIYDLGSIDLVSAPTVSAKHVYADGLLQGTTLNLDGAPIEGRAWSATVTNAAGTVVRTLSGTGDLSSDETDATWPYLPKGSYTVSYTYTNSDGKAITAALPLNVATPTLTLTVDGYTAHTKYEQGDADAANACDRLTFYAPSARFSVADALLKNATYSHSYVRTFNGKSATTNETTNIPAWADYTGVPVSGSLYTFAVTASFAGESVTASKTVRITGLPADFNPPTKATGWSNDKGTTDFESSYVRLGNFSWSQPHRIKNTSWFNIPSGVKLTLDYNIVLHRAAVNTTANVKAGSQEIVTVTNSSYGQDVTNAGTKTITTNAAVTTVTCEGSYGSGDTHTKVYTLNFKYGK